MTNTLGKRLHSSGLPVASGEEISFIREGSPLIYNFIRTLLKLKLTTKFQLAYELRMKIKESMMRRLVRKLV